MAASETLQGLVQEWAASPYQIHKRPPFRARSFDEGGSFWVVGSTNVSVLHGSHGEQHVAEAVAAKLNDAWESVLMDGATA